MTRLRAGALLVVAVLVLAGCTSSTDDTSEPTDDGPASSTDLPPPATGAEPTAAPTVSWVDCTEAAEDELATQPDPPTDRRLTWECGDLPVPLDYADPGGAGLTLAVVRGTLVGDGDRSGALVVNPGGPGGSGIDAALNLAYTMPLEAVSRFAIVGFDPRGVNNSDPVECVSDAQTEELYGAEPYARDDAEFELQVDLARQVADDCFQAYGDDLGLYNTTETARDMDQLRAALGEEKLTYLGYSYGTTLGSTYAELFPDKVRALVLDGATDPTLTEMESTEAQARGFQSAFDAFAAACLLEATCAVAPDPAAAVDAVLDAARAQPLPAGADRELPVGLAFTGLLQALYDETEWPVLSQALGAALGGDGSGLAWLADRYTGRQRDGSYPNRLEANLAVNCADHDDQYTDEEIRAFVEELRGRYPIFGAPIAANLVFCQQWRAPRHPLPERDAAGAPSILVVGTVNDPATPYTGAVALAGALESGVLLTWNGEGHTAYPKTECVTRAVDAYLLDLTVPTDDTCPAG